MQTGCPRALVFNPRALSLCPDASKFYGRSIFILSPGLTAGWLVGGGLIFLMFSTAIPVLAFKQEVGTSSTGLMLAFWCPRTILRPGFRVKRLSGLPATFVPRWGGGVIFPLF